MKKALIALIFSALAQVAAAQGTEPFQFKNFKTLACTPVKNQQKTGTCWCFSALSFLESELIRTGKDEQDLSEMFVVRHVYRQKCENYVRRQGYTRFSEGGLAHDLLNAVRDFGVVPESVYPGRRDANQVFDHSKLEKDLKTRCDEFVELGKKGKLPQNWLVQVDSVLDVEFGVLPKKFEVNGQVFMATTFADHLGIRTGDYVSLTSFSHHPFWSSFILEVPDNYAHGSFYNVPLSDLMRSLNYSIQQGYTVEWDADVSNTGWAAKYGMALVPQLDWKDKNTAQREATFRFVEKEKQVTQESRQQLFDSQETTDDHLMHITGIFEEPNAGVFYQVKNSWGEISDQKGFVNVSDAYMRLNTISFTFNRNALPQDVRRRLGLEVGEVNIEKIRRNTQLPQFQQIGTEGGSGSGRSKVQNPANQPTPLPTQTPQRAPKKD